MKTILLIASLFGPAGFAAAAPLTESSFTEIIRDVNTLSTAGNAAPAKVNDWLKAPDRVRTGPESRAELTAADQTVTRVGANTVFSFADSGRTLNLEQGSMLFHAPKGLGGGTIKSGGAAAAVLGTTIIVSATADGGFKVIFLEGKGTATLAGGSFVKLHAGQLVFVLPGGKGFSPVYDINLGKLVAGSLLVNGFSHDLSSRMLIQAAIDQQQAGLAAGLAIDTGLPPGNFGGLDPGSAQIAAHPPLSSGQFSVYFKPNPAIKTSPPGFGGRGIAPTAF
jgi:hypothetical protein